MTNQPFTTDFLPIDPDLATEILARPAANRPLYNATVDRYADAMQRGEWRTTPQGICLSPDGQLLDGQHRLHAIIRSGRTIDMAVFFDVDPAVFDVLDTGKRRSGGDILALQGETNAVVLAAALKYLHLYLTAPNRVWSGTITAVSPHQLIETLEAHPEMRRAVNVGPRLGAATGMITSAACVAAYVTDHSDIPEHGLTEWYTGLLSGAGLEPGSPCLALRETLRRTKDRTSGTRRRRDTQAHLSLYMRALVAWRNGEQMTRVQLPSTMPTLTLNADTAA